MPVVNTEVLDTTSDVATTTTLLHETIPMTGSILSGTYGTLTAGDNIKNYTHGMFQSVYDYPYLSSSANQLPGYRISRTQILQLNANQVS